MEIMEAVIQWSSVIERRVVQRRCGRDRRSLSRLDPELDDRRRLPNRRSIQIFLESRKFGYE